MKLWSLAGWMGLSHLALWSPAVVTTAWAESAAAPMPTQRARMGVACRKMEYPELAQHTGPLGAITLRVDVAKDGRVQSVDVQKSSGTEDLDRAVASALRECEFAPAKDAFGHSIASVELIVIRLQSADQLFRPWQGISVPVDSFPETAVVKAIPITGKSLISSDERAVVLQRMRAQARKQAGCASIESLQVRRSRNTPPPNLQITRVVTETWTLRQCAYARHYEVHWFTYRDHTESSLAIPQATDGRVEQEVLPASPGLPAVYESQVMEEYERMVTFDGPTEYLVRHIEVKTRTEAEAVLGRLRDGEAFDVLARDAAIRQQGAELGWQLPSALPWPLRQTVVSRSVPGLVPVAVPGVDSWHVLEVLQTRPRAGGVPVYEVVHDALARRIQDRQRISR